MPDCILADRASRFFALVIDLVLIYLPLFALQYGGGHSWDDTAALMTPMLMLGNAGLFVLTGQSLGKRLLGIEVVSLTGHPLSSGRAMVRLVVGLLFNCVGGLNLINVGAIFGPSRRCGHDRVAGTLVVVKGSARPLEAEEDLGLTRY